MTVLNKVKGGIKRELWLYHGLALAWFLVILVVSIYLSRRPWPKGRLRREHTPRGGKLLT